MVTSIPQPACLSPSNEDVQMMLAAQCHIGTKNIDPQMSRYVWKRREDGLTRHAMQFIIQERT